MIDEQTSHPRFASAMNYPLSFKGNQDERRVLIDKKLISYHSDSGHFSSEREHKKDAGLVLLLELVAILFFAGIIILLVGLPRGAGGQSNEEASDIVGGINNIELPMGIQMCHKEPCFTPAKIRVSGERPKFPSFWNYAHQGQPLQVSYDNRAMKINGERVFFLGGSMHPSRATKKTWNYALDEAVRNGLNLITIYVMWSDHQPFPAKAIDWSFSKSVECDNNAFDDSCNWSLATAIRSAANRGLFVHLRIGPYDCAEYNYGGIPEWLALNKPKMAMRRPNQEWLEVMEGFVRQIIDYISKNQLWAHQGGNIIMGQIENELGGDVDSITENLLYVDANGNFLDPDAVVELPVSTPLRNATLQDYADWCGTLVDRLAPNVTWTMCNGLSAKNTINTCNDVGGGIGFLEKYGGNGRIQIDQPPIFTEFEGGFQTWGEEADHPNDYFWGRTARDMARDALRWFARGGTHLNYYMWWGGYNRGRQAAAGITNMYASDTALCPSGQRRQPKFGHFEALHAAITDIVPTLLAADTALGKEKTIPFWKDDGTWETGDEQRIFEYRVDEEGFKHVIFVENDSKDDKIVQVPIGDNKTMDLIMSPASAIILMDGMVEFDSASIDPRKMAFERKFEEGDAVPMLLDWSSWKETVGAPSGDPMTWTRDYPVEQTEMNVGSRVYSDYAWYETWFNVGDHSIENAILFIETQRASAFVIYIDDENAGAADDHLHKEGPTTLTADIGQIKKGKHKLSFLSESLGYNNLIGRWGGSTHAKPKGITGDVILSYGDHSKNFSLVDGRGWRSFPGLHAESVSGSSIHRDHLEKDLKPVWGRPLTPTWSSALFDTPRYDPTTQGLFLKITSGRGHLWLNGKDLGRYWNITRSETQNYTQEYYLLPDDYFHTGGRLNDIVLFDAFGETNRDSESSAKLVLSWIAPADLPNLFDEVDFPLACV